MIPLIALKIFRLLDILMLQNFMNTNKIFIYDTTLRDGSQGEGISFSLQDKLSITSKLDDLGVDYIEGGYPIANPKDESYFKEVNSLKLRHAQIDSFGNTRRPDKRAEEDQ